MLVCFAHFSDNFVPASNFPSGIDSGDGQPTPEEMPADGAVGVVNGQTALVQSVDRGLNPADKQGITYPPEAYYPQSGDPRALGTAGTEMGYGGVDVNNVYNGDPNLAAGVTQGQQLSYAPDGYMQIGETGAGVVSRGTSSPGLAYRPVPAMNGAGQPSLNAEDQVQLIPGSTAFLDTQAQTLQGGVFYLNNSSGNAFAGTTDPSRQPLTLDPRTLAELSQLQRQGLGPEAFYPGTGTEFMTKRYFSDCAST